MIKVILNWKALKHSIIFVGLISSLWGTPEEGVLKYNNYKLFKAQKINQEALQIIKTPRVSVVMGLDDLGGYATYIAQKMVEKAQSFRPVVYAIDLGLSISDQTQLKFNIQHQGLEGIVQIIRGTHKEGLRIVKEELSNQKIDFFFWGPKTNQKDIKIHLQDWWPLIGSGGVFLGDHYGDPDYKDFLPQAVDAFATQHQLVIYKIDVWKGRAPWMWYFRKEESSKFVDKGVDEQISVSSSCLSKLQEIVGRLKPFVFGCKVFEGVTDELGWSHASRIAFFKSLNAEMIGRFQGLGLQLPARSIPLTTHAIWLTNPLDPQDPVDLQRGNGDPLLTYYLKSLDVMDASWNHVLWCLYPEQIAKTKKLLKEKGVHVRSVYDPKWNIYGNMRAPHIFTGYVVKGLWSLAANYLRQELLYQKGGFYRDITIEIKYDPLYLLSFADNIFSSRSYTAGKDRFDYFDQDICASSPKSPIQKRCLEILASLHEPHDGGIVPILRRHFGPIPGSHPNLVRPPMLMWAVESVLREGELTERPRVLWLDEAKVFKRHGNNSRVHGRFGSAKEQEVTVDLFSLKPPPEYGQVTSMYRSYVKNASINDMTYLLHEQMGDFSYTHQEDFKEKVLQRRFQHYLTAEKALLHLHETSSAEEEPLLFHRMWLTDDTEVPDHLLQNFIDSFALQDTQAIVYFWCLDPQKIPKTVERLLRDFPRVLEIKTIDHDLHDFTGKWLYEFYLNNKVWAPACDIARYFVLGEYGGLYSDMGMEFRYNLAPFMRQFDYMIGNFLKWADMCFIYVRKDYVPHTQFLDFITHLKEKVPPRIRARDMYRNLYIHNSLLLMSWIDIVHKPGSSKILLVPDNSLFRRQGLNSWNKEKQGFGRSVHNSEIGKLNFFYDT